MRVAAGDVIFQSKNSQMNVFREDTRKNLRQK